METINLVESFSEFKEFKNIDRSTMMLILEDVFNSMLEKKYGSADNFDIIVNIDKGDLEVWHNRTIVEDGEAVSDTFAEAGLKAASGDMLTRSLIPQFVKSDDQLVVSSERLRWEND